MTKVPSCDAAAVHVVNGVTVARLVDDRTTEGPLSKERVQLRSEGAEIFFRSFTVRPIRAVPRQ